MLLAIIIVLTGVALGVVYSRPTTTTTTTSTITSTTTSTTTSTATSTTTHTTSTKIIPLGKCKDVSAILGHFPGYIPYYTVTFLVARYLIIGGLKTMTEVLEMDLISSRSTPSYGELPDRRRYSVGAIFDNDPIICGGQTHEYKIYDTCISFQNSQWKQSHSMNEMRTYAAGVQINSTAFWILGGQYYSLSCYCSVYLDSTEFIFQGQSNGVPGPKLPYDLQAMCAVKLSSTEIFVIGGISEENNYIESM